MRSWKQYATDADKNIAQGVPNPPLSQEVIGIGHQHLQDSKAKFSNDPYWISKRKRFHDAVYASGLDENVDFILPEGGYKPTELDINLQAERVEMNARNMGDWPYSQDDGVGEDGSDFGGGGEQQHGLSGLNMEEWDARFRSLMNERLEFEETAMRASAASASTEARIISDFEHMRQNPIALQVQSADKILVPEASSKRLLPSEVDLVSHFSS